MSRKSSITDSDVLMPDSLYRTLLDRLPAAVYVCDAKGHVTYFNQAAVALWVPEATERQESWVRPGIGLAICKKIVENHNGVLTAEGFPGKGATFHIYLPAEKGPKTKKGLEH